MHLYSRLRLQKWILIVSGVIPYTKKRKGDVMDINTNDLPFMLFLVGAALASIGSIFVSSPVKKMWKITGIVMAGIGAVLGVVAMFITSGVAAILILVIFASVTALMYRHGMLPKI